MKFKLIQLRGYHHTPVGPAKQNIPIAKDITVEETPNGLIVSGRGKAYFYPWGSINDAELDTGDVKRAGKAKAAEA